jgi:hypothetical protein
VSDACTPINFGVRLIAPYAKTIVRNNQITKMDLTSLALYQAFLDLALVKLDIRFPFLKIV